MKLAIIILALLSVFCLADTDVGEPLDLIHADKLLTTGKDVNNQTNLIGNVHFHHGTTDLWSDRAIWYRKTNLVVFIDSVRVVDSTRVLTCQHLTYYRNTGSAMAVGTVKIEDKIEKVRLEANKVNYYREEDKFIATGGPMFTLNPEDDSAKTAIEGEEIVFYAGEKTGEVLNDVIITRQDLKATADRAEFYDSGEIIKLLENPLVIQDNNELEGDEITVYTKEKTINNMLIEGDARATYRQRDDTTATDYTEAILEGKQLEVFFFDDEIEKAVMRRNATSYYNPSSKDTVARGRNVASGDSITLFFKQGDIERVQILGGAQGFYEESKTRRVEGELETYADTTFYEGAEIDYNVENNVIKLIDRGKLKYQNMTLESADIRYDVGEEILVAEGRYIQTDSGEVYDQGPTLNEGSDKLRGHRMTYNIGTRKGKVELGKTKLEDKHFFGDEVRQVDKDVLYVRSGKVIPCKDENANVHFYGHKMKIINKDKLIARPVIMFLGPLPVFALPYIVFPIEKGRRSGITTFTLGSFEEGERYIRDIGYYWAASDYWDAKATLDYYENSRTTLNGTLRYNVKYLLSGNINTSYTRASSWSNYSQTRRNDWRVNFRHNQKITETMTLAGSGTFVSSKTYNLDNTYDQDERLQRTISSNMSLTKSWRDGILRNLVIAADENWNLDTDVKTRHLPIITLSSNSIQLFKPKEKDESLRVLPWIEEEDEDDDRWYHSVRLSFNSKFNNDQRYYTSNEIKDWKKINTLYSTMRLSMNPKLFGVLTFTPSLNLQQTFYNIQKVHDADSTDVETGTIASREVWSASIGTGTTMYGTFYPNFLGITGFRHVISPSASYNFAPETKKNEEYQDYTGVGSSSRRQRNFSFGLSNNFQMKIGSGENEKKLDLLTVNFSSGYDIEADAKKVKPLRTSVNTGAIKIVNLSASFAHDFYDESISLNLLDPYLTSLSLSASFSRKIVIFKGEGSGSGSKQDISDDGERGKLLSIPGKGGEDDFEGSDEASLGISLSHRYTESRSFGHVTGKTRFLECDFDLNLTKGWKIESSFRYDLEDKRTEFPVVSFSRDLNCWAGVFEWRPSGSLSGYFFKIYIKQLPDIKVEQSTGGLGGSSFR